MQEFTLIILLSCQLKIPTPFGASPPPSLLRSVRFSLPASQCQGGGIRLSRTSACMKVLTKFPSILLLEFFPLSGCSRNEPLRRNRECVIRTLSYLSLVMPYPVVCCTTKNRHIHLSLIPLFSFLSPNRLTHVTGVLEKVDYPKV